MQQNFYQGFSPKLIFTNADFKKEGESQGFVLGQVPYHRAGKYIGDFVKGRIPEWRSFFSAKWLKKKISGEIDVVYSFVYSPSTLLWGHWISIKKRCRHIIHIADHSKLFFEPKCLNTIKKANSLLVISNRMKTLYEEKTQRRDIKVFHNFPDNRCFPEDASSMIVKHPFSKSNPLILTFIGGLYSYLHKDSIEDILNAVSKHHNEGSPVEIHLYGERYPQSFLEEEISQKGIIHHGLVMPLERKYEIMKKSHAFVIPSSFDHKINQDYQYSFPTKLTEFIASGKPVIYYGPNNTAASNFCKKHKGIILIDTKSQNSIFNTLSRLINDYQNLKYASEENSESIKDTLSKEIILNNFHNHLLHVISE
jgi:glycosyltransferase involved in cell wall biosynthesis